VSGERKKKQNQIEISKPHYLSKERKSKKGEGKAELESTIPFNAYHQKTEAEDYTLQSNSPSSF
jgi:hypothetical protein